MSYTTGWDRSNRILSKKYYGDINPVEWQASNAELFAMEEGRAFVSAHITFTPEEAQAIIAGAPEKSEP